jgi:ribosomal protein L11 methylase PrmA
LAAALKPSGKLLLSGLLVVDEMELLLKSREHNLIHLGTVEREGWVSILFSY